MYIKFIIIYELYSCIQRYNCFYFLTYIQKLPQKVCFIKRTFRSTQTPE